MSRLAVVGGLEFSVRQSGYALSAEIFPVEAWGIAGSENSADFSWVCLSKSRLGLIVRARLSNTVGFS
jgi:hypothetical protein